MTNNKKKMGTDIKNKVSTNKLTITKTNKGKNNSYTCATGLRT
jgi:hypothetical protein